MKKLKRRHDSGKFFSPRINVQSTKSESLRVYECSKTDCSISVPLKRSKNFSQPCPPVKKLKVDAYSASQGIVSGIRVQQKSGESYGIILPLIMNEDQEHTLQPYLIVIGCENLHACGLNFDDDFFLDEEINLFKAEIGSTEFHFRFIALGVSFSDLRTSLTTNVKRNSEWTQLKKLISLTKNRFRFTSSSLDFDDLDPFIQMSIDEQKLLFSDANFNGPNPQLITQNGKVKKYSNNQEHVNESEKSRITKRADRMKNQREKEEETYSKKLQPPGDLQNTNGISTREKRRKIHLDALNEKIEELNRKKMILSEIDSTGNILKLVIETFGDFFTFICDKYQEGKNSFYEIPEEDETSKIRAKNLVFIEGQLLVKLYSYEAAVKTAKPGCPCSIAYQLVRIAFPEAYYKNITLGEKYYSNSEFEGFKKILIENGQDSSTKFPLVFALSFRNQFTTPFEGPFDIKLGKNRLESLFNHIFRKAGIMKYTEEELNKVRLRIIKLLCDMNKEIEKVTISSDAESETESNTNSLEIYEESDGTDEDVEILTSEIFK